MPHGFQSSCGNGNNDETCIAKSLVLFLGYPKAKIFFVIRTDSIHGRLDLGGG